MCVVFLRMSDVQWEYNDVFGLGDSYAKIPLCMIHRNDLSAKAKVVFAYMTCKPGGYQFAAKRIAKHFSEGYRTILSAINELCDKGYAAKKKLANGRMYYQLRENYWSLTEEEAKESLFCGYPDAFKATVEEYESVSFNDVLKEIRGYMSGSEAVQWAGDYVSSCLAASLPMNTDTFSKWMVHVRNAASPQSLCDVVSPA